MKEQLQNNKEICWQKRQAQYFSKQVQKTIPMYKSFLKKLGWSFIKKY